MAAHPKPVVKAQRASDKMHRQGAVERCRQTVPAAKAKAHLLQMLDKVEREGEAFTITKRGRVVAQLVPVEAQPAVSVFDQVYGRTAGWMEIVGDIVSPDPESWGPDWK